MLRGGRVVSASGEFDADVAVAGGRVAAVGGSLAGGARELDASGLYVIPGAVDGHVHLNDPTFPPHATFTADDFATGTRAAAFGGVTTVIDFAQPAVGQPLLDGLDARMADAADAVIDYALHLNVRDPDPVRAQEIPGVFARGVPSFKLYMSYPGYRISDEAIFRAMCAIADGSGLAVLHAENDDVIAVRGAALAAAGRSGPRWLAEACPPEGEAEAVHRAIALAGLAGARLLVFHLSCGEAVREVARAKTAGQAVWGEVTTHGLVFDASVRETDDLRAQSFAVRPPIRDGAQRDALWSALARGEIDIVSSDHCPRVPLEDSHPAGVSGIETRLALVHHFGVGSGLIDLPRWVEVCATAPARIHGLDRKGRIEPGADADIVLFDPRREVALSAEQLHSALPFSSYDGIVVRGFPVVTISRGEVIVEGGEFVGAAGRGRFVERGR